MTLTARTWFRKGQFCKRIGCNIVEGWRAEITSELSNGLMLYTGVCETRQAAVAELVQQLKDRNLHGKLRVE